MARRPNYNFEKHRREQEKKRKKEEKRLRKLEKTEPKPGDQPEPPAE